MEVRNARESQTYCRYCGAEESLLKRIERDGEQSLQQKWWSRGEQGSLKVIRRIKREGELNPHVATHLCSTPNLNIF